MAALENNVLRKKAIQVARDIQYYAPRHAPGHTINPPSYYDINEAFSGNQAHKISEVVCSLANCLIKVNKLNEADELLDLAKQCEFVQKDHCGSLPELTFHHGKKLLKDTFDILTLKNHKNNEENHTHPISIIKNDLFGIFKPLPSAKDTIKSLRDTIKKLKILAGEKPINIQIKEEKEASEFKTPSL